MDNVIELEEMGIIVKVPEQTVSLELVAKVMNDEGEIIKVQKNLTPSELRKARADFESEVILGDLYDAEFVLTDKGRELAQSLVEECDEF